MKLIKHWQVVMRHAWSVRLMLLAIMMEVVAAVLPLISGQSLPWTVLCNLAAGLLITAAFVARLVAQKGFEDETI